MSKGKKALIIRGGTMKGAFVAGVMQILHEKLGVDYFDVIYSNSVGIFEQAFFASCQPEIIDKVWSRYVHGKQLVKFSNIFRKKPILDLDYLMNLFKSKEAFLDIEKMKSAKPDLFCVATHYDTRKPEIFDLKKEDVFQVMLATSAVPILYNKKIFINDKRYHDGSLTAKGKFKKLISELLDKDFNEITVIMNKKNQLKSKDPRVFVIEPSKMPLYHHLDTNQKRILETIEQGKKDTLEFLKNKNAN